MNSLGAFHRFSRSFLYVWSPMRLHVEVYIRYACIYVPDSDIFPLLKITDARFSRWPFPAKLRHPPSSAPTDKPAAESNLVHGVYMIWCVCSPTSTPPDLKKGSTGVKSNSLRENGSSLRKMAKVRFGWPTHWYLGVMQWKLKYQSLQSISKTVTPCGSSFNGLRPSRRDWRKKRPGLFLIFHEVYIYTI